MNTYIPPEVNGGVVPEMSNHGFGYYRLPKTAKMDNGAVVKMFNEYLAPSLSLYMNLLSKNPSKDARKFIDKEFTDYCSNPERSADDEDINKLMNFAKGIVASNGSNANYNVAPLSNDAADIDNTNFSYIPDFLPAMTLQEEYYPGKKTEVMSTVANRVVIDVMNIMAIPPRQRRSCLTIFKCHLCANPPMI